MRYYGLSENRVLRILRNPKRVESGIAENTTAAMQRAGSIKHPYEIWMMHQTKLKRPASPNASLGGQRAKGKSKKDYLLNKEKQLVIISAWKYPGVTKPGSEIPIPEDTMKELRITNKLI